jgi:hypothetical protein
MNFAHQNKVDCADGIKLGIVSPDGRQGMIDHARQFAEAGIPFIFDPGQGLPMFNGEELLSFHPASRVSDLQRLRSETSAGTHWSDFGAIGESRCARWW